MVSKEEFYSYPNFQPNGSFLIKNMTLLQVDIACHSQMSKSNAAEKVMEAKISLADQLRAYLEPSGFKGVFWAGDGGMFATELISGNSLIALIEAWQRIKLVVDDLNSQYGSFLDGKIRLRVSAHMAMVRLHPDPRFWHADELNFFAKRERDIGEVDVFRITGAIYNELPNPFRSQFQKKLSIDEDKNHEIYEFVKDGVSQSIPNPMRQITPIINKIIRDSEDYRKKIRKSGRRKRKGKGDVLIVVDIQKDFCNPSASHLAHLYVKGTEELVSSVNKLIQEALSKKIPIIFARDWHPGNHPSFFDNDGVWKAHCVAKSEGAQFHDKLNIPAQSAMVNIGVSIRGRDYTPFSDPALLKRLRTINPKRILVAGIALEYCVLATCLDALAHVDEVAILEDNVRAAEPDSEGAKIVWRTLRDAGVSQIKNSKNVFRAHKKQT